MDGQADSKRPKKHFRGKWVLVQTRSTGFTSGHSQRHHPALLGTPQNLYVTQLTKFQGREFKGGVRGIYSRSNDRILGTFKSEVGKEKYIYRLEESTKFGTHSFFT